MSRDLAKELVDEAARAISGADLEGIRTVTASSLRKAQPAVITVLEALVREAGPDGCLNGGNLQDLADKIGEVR